MWGKARFYLRYALNNLRVNPRQSFFGMLCVAAGVAAIVSLQTLGVMIRDSFTGNLQETNLADIRVLPRPREGVAPEVVRQGRTEGLISAQETFRLDAVRAIEGWLAENYPDQYTLTYRQSVEGNAGLLVTNLRTSLLNPLTIPYLVDTDLYPLYGEIRAENGDRLDELIEDVSHIVLSRNLAESLDARVGDRVRLNNVDIDFTVRGIVNTNVQGGLEPLNVAAGVLGFYYADHDAVPYFANMNPRSDAIYIRLDRPRSTEEINRALLAAFPFLSTVTTEDLADQNSAISDAILKLVSVMGLVSMLIGGVGIINTMLVLVRRRTAEIAILKTIGLEPNQVTLLFLVEAILIGVVGSLIGVVLGWIGAYLIQGVATAFMSQAVPFRITPGPPLTGLAVGILVSTVFGFLPTLSAGQIRPALVLHPLDEVIPAVTRVRTMIALIMTLGVLSLVAQALVGDLSGLDLPLAPIAGAVGALLGLLVGLLLLVENRLTNGTRRRWPIRLLRRVSYLLGAPLVGLLFGYFIPSILLLFATFALVGVLYILLWLMIWLVGHLAPTWMIFELKVALRSLMAARGRSASTLLVLVVGVFALSLITMLVDAIRQRFVEQLVQETGGNVLIYVANNSLLQRVETVLDQNYGEESYAVVKNYRVRLVSVVDAETGETLAYTDLQENLTRQFGNDVQRLEEFRSTVEAIDARAVTANLPDFPLYSGRQLGPDDSSEPVMIMAANDTTLAAGLSVGDQVTYLFQGGAADTEGPNTLTFTIVGMTDRRNSIVSGVSAPNYAPLALFSDQQRPNDIRVIMDIDDSRLAELREDLRIVPNTFVLEAKSLNDLLNRVVDQFSSFPILVAGLALFTGGVVIANSVALSAIDRQRDIATMKAVGLGRWRVLGMLLLEYGLMGFIGGLIGIGISASILGGLLAAFFQGDPGGSVSYPAVFGLMLLCVGIALFAALISAWGASGEKPLNVLRYK